MNEGNFFLFFTYLFDLHNLKIEGNLRSIAHPKSQQRYCRIASLNDVENLSKNLAIITLKEQFSKSEEVPDNIVDEDSNLPNYYDKADSIDGEQINDSSPQDIEEVDKTNSIDGVQINDSSPRDNEEVDKEKPYKCPTCGMTYKRKNGLTSHIKNKHKEDVLLCELCNKKCGDASNLRKHMQSKHFCKHCGKSVKDLNEHVNEHLKCHVCGKEFDKMWKITKHKKSHI